MLVADIELECLATWKDGSETYLYARLTGAHLHSRDERFRCFVSCIVILGQFFVTSYQMRLFCLHVWLRLLWFCR